MATLIVPTLTADDEKISVWPSLGHQVAEWLEGGNAVWGPGSKFGQATTLDDEFYAWLVRAYQVYPHGHRLAGRRRFNLAALELTKGTGKTEKAIQVAQAEIHPHAPVRTRRWERRGRYWSPVGGPVQYPRLIFLAHTEDQVLRTAFGRFRETMKRSPHADMFHITQEKIVLLGEAGAAAGEAYPMAISPDSADGDLPTWQHIDEPHRWTDVRHHEMVSTIEENAAKDSAADSWTMATSTPGIPGQQSVEEDFYNTAQAIVRGEVDRPTLFFFRRHCPDTDEWPLTTEAEVEAAVLEARGPAAEWSGDIPRVVTRWFDPKTDRSYWERVWLGRWKKSAGMAFDPIAWAKCGPTPRKPWQPIEPGAHVTLGFDGARRRDATGLVVTEISTGKQEVLYIQQRPLIADEDWEIDPADVDAAVAAAFDRFDVWRLYADPPYWDEWVDHWAGRHGEKNVVRWWTNRNKPMAHALRGFKSAIDSGVLRHDGNDLYGEHIANAMKKTIPQRDDQDVELWLIRKANADSPDKIDLAMAGCLSWEARSDAIAAGITQQKKKKIARFV